MGLALTVGFLLPLSIIIYQPVISAAKWFDISLNWKLNWNVFLELMAQKQLGDVLPNSVGFGEDTNG
uniref:Uncharacterized protein n=1 Tax=Anopheles albimanus TaxID=7167 RepID=A0A182FXA2_ANOAL